MSLPNSSAQTAVSSEKKEDCKNDGYDCYGDIVFDIKDNLSNFIVSQTAPDINLDNSPKTAVSFFNNAASITRSQQSGSSHYAAYKASTTLYSGNFDLGSNITSLNNHFFSFQNGTGICGLNLKVKNNNYYRLGCVWNNENYWSSSTQDQHWGVGHSSYSAKSVTSWCNKSSCYNKSLRKSSSNSNFQLNFVIFGRCLGDGCE